MEKQDGFLTFYIVIFACFLGFIGTFWQLTTAPGITGRPAQSASIGIPTVCTSGMTTLPFMVLLLVGFLSRLGIPRGRVNYRSLTCIYVVSLISSYYLAWLSPCSSWGVFFGARIQNPDIMEQYVAWFMAPSPEVAEGILVGGLSPPWIDLLPSMLFWWIYTFLNAVMMLCWATIFRKNWIDVEKVPFPHVMAAYELLSRVGAKETHLKRTLSIFAIGMILGAIFQAPIMMSDLFPWFPDIYGWRTNTCTSGQWYVTPDSPLSSIVGLATAQKDPLAVAIAYFAPLNVLFNVWFWYFVCIIVLSQVAFNMGYYTGITQVDGCGRIWCNEYLAYGEPFKWQAVSSGAAFGLALLIIFHGRKYLLNTIKAALGLLSPEEKAQLERNEPISYRTVYSIFAVSLALLTIMYIIMGLSLVSAIIIQVSILTFWLAFIRQVGIAGFFYMGEHKTNPLARILLYPMAPEQLNKDFILLAYFTNLPINSPENGFQVGGNFFSSFYAYQMANLTSTNNRDVFLTVLVASLVLPIATLFGFYYTIYVLGISKISGNWAVYGCNKLLSDVEAWNLAPAADPWVPHFFAGILVTVALSILHSMFVWFPFEPIGFTLAISKAVLPWGIWSSALVAWVLKTITLRVGGSKLYESVGAPLASGFIAGYMSILIIGTIVAHIKFWFPF